MQPRIGIEHDVAQPLSGADPFADNRADGRHRRRHPQARAQRRQGSHQADMPQLSAEGGVHAARQIEILLVDPSQAIKEQRGEGKDRDRLTGEDQRHQPALQTRREDHTQRQGDTERHAQRQAAQDLTERDKRVPAEIGAINPQRLGDRHRGG